MSDTQARLKETSQICLENYENWQDSPKEAALREKLQESIHELRKVVSRLEIDIAISERDGAKNKSIPIPSHRSHQRTENGRESILPDRDNGNGGDDGGKSKPRGASARRGRPRKNTGDDN